MTESSEHFAEYVPWFIKSGREDLIGNEFFDEYPKMCRAIEEAKSVGRIYIKKQIDVPNSVEYASQIINSV